MNEQVVRDAFSSSVEATVVSQTHGMLDEWALDWEKTHNVTYMTNLSMDLNDAVLLSTLDGFRSAVRARMLIDLVQLGVLQGSKRQHRPFVYHGVGPPESFEEGLRTALRVLQEYLPDNDTVSSVLYHQTLVENVTHQTLRTWIQDEDAGVLLDVTVNNQTVTLPLLRLHLYPVPDDVLSHRVPLPLRPFPDLVVHTLPLHGWCAYGLQHGDWIRAGVMMVLSVLGGVRGWNDEQLRLAALDAYASGSRVSSSEYPSIHILHTRAMKTMQFVTDPTVPIQEWKTGVALATNAAILSFALGLVPVRSVTYVSTDALQDTFA